MTELTEDTEEQIARALGHLQNLLAASDLEAEAAPPVRDGDTVTLAITGPDAGLLVGPHGTTLDALQYLLLLMTNKGRDHRLRITVDADRYRERRAQTLSKFARSLAAQVMETGQEAVTDPLNPMERRIIHTALVDYPEVRTYSEGDEPNRYVVVSPQSLETEA